MTYYMADLIENKHDATVLDAATLDVMSCASLDPTQYAIAQQMAQQAAQQELNLGDHETRLAMGVIKELVRRMAAMPGQRTIILVSGGFVTLAEHSTEKTEIMDRAIRASVLINALDARGLYTDTPDITRSGTNYRTDMVLHQMERETNRAQSDVMAELAAGTGATLFQNNNDLDAGFARLATAPEYYYLLAFSPQNLKMDGSFHALKVTLKSREGRQRERAHGLLRAAASGECHRDGQARNRRGAVLARGDERYPGGIAHAVFQVGRERGAGFAGD